MSSSLERWLWLANPLFAVASSSKRKRGKKPAKRSRPKPTRSAKPRRAKKQSRRAARLAPHKGQARSKAAARRRPGPLQKSAQKPVAKVTPPSKPVEPLPKPVPPVGRPLLLSPEDGKYADSVNPKFRWLSVGGATRYEVNWSLDPNFANAYTVISVATEAGVPVEKPLTIGVAYHWRARGGNEAGWGPWSNIGSFSVLEETE